jgi:hypothetical protein
MPSRCMGWEVVWLNGPVCLERITLCSIGIHNILVCWQDPYQFDVLVIAGMQVLYIPPTREPIPKTKEVRSSR